ncbi:MAG: SLBB domain-containing protein [Deltaproteobacteria bacterium]|nr:SLBB domain-containing protein [Deltaproteobacteria bacterium]
MKQPNLFKNLMTSSFSKCLVVFLIFSFVFPFPVWAQYTSQLGLQRQLGGSQNNSNPNDPLTPGSVTDLSQSNQNRQILQQAAGLQGGAGQGLGFGLVKMQTIQVHILGDVQNPGLFTVQAGTRAADLLKLAVPTRASVRVIELRKQGERGKTYDLYRYFQSGDLKNNPFVEDNDVIFVPNPKGAVRIEGPVARPGVFELYYEKNLSQILSLAGGVTKSVAKKAPIRVIRFTEDGQKIVLDVEQNRRDIKKFEIEKGDVIIVPDIINSHKKFDYSVESIPGENLVYPTSVADVFVIGAVISPGAFPYKSHFRIKDYVAYAGATAEARLGSVIVFRNGKKVRRKLEQTIQAGDVIIVKKKAIENFVKYVGIISSVIGVTLSALVLERSLNNR